MKLTSFLQLVDKLQRAGKIDNLEQVCAIFGCVEGLHIDLAPYPNQRVDTIKREMFSQKSVRRFVGDSSAFVMGAMFLASALNRGISSRY